MSLKSKEIGLFRIGCDPELMICDKVSGGLKSAIRILKGRKDSPEDIKGGGKVHSDNVNLEFNIPPSDSASEFISNMKMALSESKRLAGTTNNLIVRASANFPENELSDPEAREFGCEPDFNAWLVQQNEMSKSAADSPFRTCGGHIHIGYTEKSREVLESFEGKIRTIKAMDAVLGILSIVLDTDPTSMERRMLYGGAGAHRPKDYGVEYRAIGNFWVKSPKLVELIYNLTEFTVDLCLKGNDLALIKEIGEERIRTTINSSAKSEAQKIIKDNLNKILPKNIQKQIADILKSKFDFYKEWSL